MNVYICNENSQSTMIKQRQKHKIVLVGDSLSGGGAEKVHALLSVYFKNSGIEVYNCIFVDLISYEHAGSLLNLGKVKPDSFFIFRKIKRFFVFKKFIKENNFDFVIDFRMRTNFVLEFLFSKFVYPKNICYTVHSGILEFYFPKSSFLSNLVYKNRNILSVSKGIQDLIIAKKLAQNVTHIYNPIDFEIIDTLKNKFIVDEEKFILAAGRMNDQVKQFDKLILAYSKSILPSCKIKLILLGEGKNQPKYRELSKQLGIEDLIIFNGFTENPFPYFKSALFTVLSSKNEGFPNVILESLACDTPVISFDCFSGPNEIIVDKKNGLLVENQNFEKLTEAMNLFVENSNLYNSCKADSRKSATQFSIENIGNTWLEYLKISGVSKMTVEIMQLSKK